MTSQPFGGLAWLVGALACGCTTPHPAAGATRPPASAVSSQSSEIEARLVKETSRIAGRAGAGTLSMVAFGAAQVGDSVAGFVFVPEARCALLYARAGTSVQDLDLHAYGDDGTQFGADEAPDVVPTLLLCPPGNTRLFVSARVAQGQGVVSLAMQDVPRERAVAVAEAVGARNFAQKPKPIYEAWPGLDARIQNHRQAIGGKWADLRRVALPVDARIPTTLSLSIPEGRCLDAFIAPDDAVAHLDVLAVNATGRIFARAQERGSERFIVLCSHDRPISSTLELRPHAGQGMAAVVLSVTQSQEDRLNLSPSVVQVLADGSQALQSPALLSVPLATHRHVLSVGARTRHSITFDGCARVDLRGDERLRGAELWFWSEDGRLLGQSAFADLSPLFACSRGQLRIDAAAAERAGTLTTHWSQLEPPAGYLSKLLAMPLAASRLLTRVHTAKPSEDPSQLDSLEMSELLPTSLLRSSVRLGAAQCQIFFIAQDAEGYGVEARVFDSDTGIDLDFASGPHSVSVRACAPADRTVDLQLEVRSLHRPTPALIATQRYPLTSESVSPRASPIRGDPHDRQ